MHSYERTRQMLTLVLYNRGLILDPYSIMEAATLIHAYIIRGNKGDREGAGEILKQILSKMGYDNAEELAESIVREVLERLGVG